MGFIADPGCRRDFVTRLKSLYDAGAALIELTAARLGEDARVAVPQHDDDPWISPLERGCRFS